MGRLPAIRHSIFLNCMRFPKPDLRIFPRGGGPMTPSFGPQASRLRSHTPPKIRKFRAVFEQGLENYGRGGGPRHSPEFGVGGPFELAVSQSRPPNLSFQRASGHRKPTRAEGGRGGASRGQGGAAPRRRDRQYARNGVLRCFSGVTRVNRRTSDGARGCGEAAGTVIITGSVAECQMGR